MDEPPRRGRRATRPDPLTPAQRSRTMSRIRSRDTVPEMIVRRALHARGLRFRLHDRRLPGTPDLVLAGHRAVVFVHGCFWHGHDCRYGVAPAANAAFWAEKIARNRARDEGAERRLLDLGWRVLTIWECALRGIDRRPPDAVAEQAVAFLRSDARELTIRGGARPPASDPEALR